MENVNIILDGIQKNVYGLFYIYDSKYYFVYTEKEVDENNYVMLYMSQVGKETKNTENGPVETGYMVGVEVTDPNEQQKAQTSISYIVEDKKHNTTNPQIQYLPMSMLSNLKIVSKKRFRLLKSIMEENFKLKFESPQINAAIPEPVVAEPEVQPVETLTEIAPVMPDVTNVVDPAVVTNPEVQPLETLTEIAPVMPDVTSVVDPVVVTNPEVQSVESLTEIAPVMPDVTSVVDSVVVTNPEVQPAEPLVNMEFNVPIGSENSNSGMADNVIVDYRTKYFEEEEKNKELQSRIDELTKRLEEIKKIVE